MRSPLAPAITGHSDRIAFSTSIRHAWMVGCGHGQSLSPTRRWVGPSTAVAFGLAAASPDDLLRILERRHGCSTSCSPSLDRGGASIWLGVPPPRTDAVRFAARPCYALAIWDTTYAVIGVWALSFPAGSAPVALLAEPPYWSI